MENGQEEKPVYRGLITKLRDLEREHKKMFGGSTEESETIGAAADAIETFLEMDKWTPVAKRPPKIGQPVYVVVHWPDDDERSVCYGSRKRKGKWELWNAEMGLLLKGYEITHWRPVPNLPELNAEQ